jgi:hypothetical protein
MPQTSLVANRCSVRSTSRIAFYNFGRVHMTLKAEPPTIASGLADHVWTIRELIEESAKF